MAAVDVGILNLTNYQPPAPEDWYYGQRKLGMEIRDIYGLLIDGMQGVPGQIRSGSDDAGAAMEGSPRPRIRCPCSRVSSRSMRTARRR